MQERDQLTAKNQAHSSKNIGDRANDIDFWKSELRHETELLIAETNALAEVLFSTINYIISSTSTKNGSSAHWSKLSPHSALLKERVSAS